MKKQTITLPKGMTANEINVCVEDGKIMVSYEVEPIEPEYKAGDILDLGDGDFITLIDWNGGRDSRTFYGVYAKFEDRVNVERSERYDNGWEKHCVKGLATPEQVFQYYKAFKDSGYEWDADRLDFIKVAWKPTACEKIYFVDSELSVNWTHWRNGIGSIVKYNNYFRTEQAAQAAADQIKEVLKNAPKE